MAEPISRRGLELQQNIINSLYPIAVRYKANLPKCFMQFKNHSNCPFWQETLNIKDICETSHKAPTISKVIADQPIPLCCSLYYYEINICAKSQCGSLKAGFSFDETDKSKHKRCTTFLSYHSNTGRICLTDGDSALPAEEKETCGPCFGAGDVIGCGVNFVNNSVFFTKNGIIIGNSTAHRNLASAVMFPCIVMASPAASLIANFGQRDFVFAIAQYLAQERCNAVTQAIQGKLTADLANVKMQSLVFDYLLRHGYLATASAMYSPSSVVSPPTNTAANSTVTNHVSAVTAVSSSPNPPSLKLAAEAIAKDDTDTKSDVPPLQLNSLQKQESLESPMTETECTPTTETVPFSPASSLPKPAPPEVCWKYGSDKRWPETLEVANQRIRLVNLIIQGQYLQAISQLDRDYTGLVETMPSIVFMLRCRYFIELLFTNQRPCKGDDVEEATTTSAVAPVKATSASPNSNRKIAGKSGGGSTFKRPQPFSPLECSFHDGDPSDSCFRQSAAVRRKCEENNGSRDGADEDEEADENLHIECIRQENGSVAVLQPSQCIQNGVSALVKGKRKAVKSLFKCSSLNSVDKASETPIQNGIYKQKTYDSTATLPEPPLQPTLIAEAMPTHEKPLVSKDLSSVVQLGRELRDKAQELQAKDALSPSQIALLQDAFGLIAYENVYESPFVDLMHPRHRKNLAESVNNAILSELDLPIYIFEPNFHQKYMKRTVFVDLKTDLKESVQFILVNLGKARYPLLEMGIGMLEEAVLNGKRGSRVAEARPCLDQHNQMSTSSAGSTLTPLHTVSTFVNLPSTVGVYTTDSSPSPQTGGSGSGGLQQHHRGHRRHHHHHRSVTSTSVVTSTTSASNTNSRASNPLPFLASLPPSAASFHQPFSSSIGRRLRNTIVQSSPRDTTEEGLEEIIVSGGTDWTEEATEHNDEAGVVTAADEEAPLVSQKAGGDQYAPPLPPPQNVNVRVGGSEMTGFFHPVLFVPPAPTR